MEKQKEILERYYRGESSVQEEQTLRDAYQKGNLPNDPILGFIGEQTELPKKLMENISNNLHKKHSKRIVNRYWISIGIAATIILIIMLRGLYPDKAVTNLQLSNNIKIERFEEALRIIGNVLEEKTVTSEKVLYEDSRIIIVSE